MLGNNNYIIINNIILLLLYLIRDERIIGLNYYLGNPTVLVLL